MPTSPATDLVARGLRLGVTTNSGGFLTATVRATESAGTLEVKLKARCP